MINSISSTNRTPSFSAFYVSVRTGRPEDNNFLDVAVNKVLGIAEKEEEKGKIQGTNQDVFKLKVEKLENSRKSVGFVDEYGYSIDIYMGKSIEQQQKALEKQERLVNLFRNLAELYKKDKKVDIIIKENLQQEKEDLQKEKVFAEINKECENIFSQVQNEEEVQEE